MFIDNTDVEGQMAFGPNMPYSMNADEWIPNMPTGIDAINPNMPTGIDAIDPNMPLGMNTNEWIPDRSLGMSADGWTPNRPLGTDANEWTDFDSFLDPGSFQDINWEQAQETQPAQAHAGFNDFNMLNTQNGQVADNDFNEESFEGFGPISPVGTGPRVETFEGFAEPCADPMASHDLSQYHSSSDSGSSEIPYRELKPIVRDTMDTDSKKPWVRNNVTKGKTIRGAKIEAYDAEQVYRRIPRAPLTWGDRGKYEYHESGELLAPAYYSVKDIHTFLYQNPAHKQPGHESGLRLWIQRVPPDSARRFAQPQSSRCRFKHCFAPNRSIIRGHVRVAFDELSYANADQDPQINAGYVHLYCMERFLNFPAICWKFNVLVDTRVLPHEPDGRNRMMLPTAAEIQVAKDFISHCKTGQPPPGYPHFEMPNRPYKGTLNRMLMKARLSGEEDVCRKKRIERGTHGKSIVDHLGNLEAHKTDRDASRKRKRAPTEMRPKKKPRYVDDFIDEDDMEEDTEEEAIVVQQPRQRGGPL